MAKMFRFLTGPGSQLQVDTAQADGCGATVCSHWSYVCYNIYWQIFISPQEFLPFIAQTHEAMEIINKLLLVAN